MKILLDRNLHLDLPVAISDALQLQGALPRRREDVVPELSAFLNERLRFLLEKKGRRPDTVDAVLAADARDPADAADRAEAVDAMRGEPDFALLAAAFKRMQNILAQAPDAAGEPDPAKLTDPAEQALAGDFLQARGMIDDLLAQRRFPDALGGPRHGRGRGPQGEPHRAPRRHPGPVRARRPLRRDSRLARRSSSESSRLHERSLEDPRMRIAS